MAKLSLYLASLILGTNFAASTPPHGPAPRQGSVIRSAVKSFSPAPGALRFAGSDTTEAGRAQVGDNEQRLLDLVNRERGRNGLGSLTANSLLMQIARAHSREMWQKGYFDHISPTPELKTPMARYLKSLGRTPTWAYLGENLFYCSVIDVPRGHRSLMESKNHRENILNPQFREIGVGEFIAPDGQFYVTQLFLAQTD